MFVSLSFIMMFCPFVFACYYGIYIAGVNHKIFGILAFLEKICVVLHSILFFSILFFPLTILNVITNVLTLPLFQQ